MCKSKWILSWKCNSMSLAVFLAGGLAATAFSAQRTTTLQSSGDDKAISGTEVALTERLVKSQNIGVVKRRLMDDRDAVKKAVPTVVPEFKKAGYSDQEAVSGLAWAWYELRAGQDAVPLTRDLSLGTIQTKAAKQGRLIVKSKPNGAAISVDRLEWRGPTNAEGFADVGNRQVKVSLEGLEPAEGICDVGRDRIVTFSATLQKKGSKAECK